MEHITITTKQEISKRKCFALGILGIFTLFYVITFSRNGITSTNSIPKFKSTSYKSNSNSSESAVRIHTNTTRVRGMRHHVKQTLKTSLPLESGVRLKHAGHFYETATSDVASAISYSDKNLRQLMQLVKYS